MIIGISGKAQSGKDTVGKIIQYLTDKSSFGYTHPDGFDDYISYLDNGHNSNSIWQIHKFADALKDIICILTGCTREQLEDIEFKNNKLPDKWIRYGYANGFYRYYRNGKEETKMNNTQCDKERYELEYKTNWQTAYKVHPTYRELLQYIGTDLLRNQLHDNVWVNALFSKYKPNICSGVTHCALAGKFEISCNLCPEYPNWIITDVRFPNEVKAIKDRDGINIRVNRGKPFVEVTKTVPIYSDGEDYSKEQTIIGKKQITLKEHISETALDDYTFDYIIDNNNAIEELIEKVKDILIKEKII